MMTRPHDVIRSGEYIRTDTFENDSEAILYYSYIEHIKYIDFLHNSMDDLKKCTPSEGGILDNSVRNALSVILKVAASMLTTGISNEISEWDLPENTSLKTKKKILKEANKWNDINRIRAITLQDCYDIISKNFR